MGGNRPVTFITIGGVRYHRNSVVEQSETTDNKGNKIYNVTLEGGTKLSYPQQTKSNDVGYNVIRFDRQKGESKVSYPLKGGNRTPLVIAHKPINNNQVHIGLFGLKNATITGYPNVSEWINMTNCHNNTIYLNDNSSDEYADSYSDLVQDDNVMQNSNNTIYMDKNDIPTFIDEMDEFMYNSTTYGKGNGLNINS